MFLLTEFLDFVPFHVNSSHEIRSFQLFFLKIEALENFPKPLKQKQLLAFLGALNYYRSSLPKLEAKEPGGRARAPAVVLDPLYQQEKLTHY